MSHNVGLTSKPFYDSPWEVGVRNGVGPLGDAASMAALQSEGKGTPVCGLVRSVRIGQDSVRSVDGSKDRMARKLLVLRVPEPRDFRGATRGGTEVAE